MEEHDFYVPFSTGNDPANTDEVFGYIKVKRPSFASYISRRAGRGMIDYEEELVPCCTKPFNKSLHSLLATGEVVIKDKSGIANFVNHLHRSRHFAIDCHGCLTAED